MPTSAAPAHVSSAPGATTHTASTAARLAPVSDAAPLQTRQSGQPLAQPTANGSAAAAVKQVNAQLLQTMLQALGKPLSGHVTGSTAPTTPSGGGTMNLQLTVPKPTALAPTPAASAPTSTAPAPAGATVASAQSQALAVRLPLPAGQPAPATGTPVQVSAGSNGLTVSVSGPAPISAETLRADAVKQASLAPVLADVARMASSPKPTASIDSVLARVMGFTISSDAPVSADTLRTVIDGARGLPTGQTASGALAPTGGGMQSALGALIRALGLQVPTQSSGPQPQAPSNPALPNTSTPSQSSASTGPSAPPTDPGRPTKVPATPLPASEADVADPAILQSMKTKAENALSRLNLLQALGTEAPRGAEQATSFRWDVPLLLGQEAAVLGLVVDHDEESASPNGDGVHHWRFRFAFESQSHGGIEGLVAMRLPHGPTAEQDGTDRSGDPIQLDVAIWASDPLVQNRLERTRGHLAQALEAHGLVLTSLEIAEADTAPDLAHAKTGDDEHHLVDVAS